MLDIAFSEMALILVVAFVLLGPKELPGIIRGLSTFLRQCREVIDECKAQLDGLDTDTGARELREEGRYIRDQFGEWREVYDIQDILPTSSPDTPSAALPAPEGKDTYE